MNGEKAISIESGGHTTLLSKTVGILIVDGDSTCLTILSKMLRRFGYKVMTAKRASDALCIIRDREDEIDIVLSEAYLPDLNKHELLETVGEMSKLPVVIMSADANESDMLSGLSKGAAFYLVKPITINDIKNIWQFSFMKKTDTRVSAEGVSGNSPDKATEDKMFPYEVRQSHQNEKRGEANEMDKIEEENNDDATIQKKPKLIWTNELHNRFLQAVKVIGIDVAHPKKILEHMNVPGLKKENISSHLQKYRLSLKRDQEAKENKTMDRDFSESHPAVYDLPSTLNLQGGLLQYPEMQYMTKFYQPELGSRGQKNLISSSMFMPSLTSAYFRNHAGPSCNDTSNFKYGQLIPPSTGLTYPGWYHEGIGTTSHGKLAGLHQAVDSNGEEFLNGKMAFLSCGDSGLASALERPSLLTQQQNQEFLNRTMAFSSCGDSGAGTAVQWPTLLVHQQDEERKVQQLQQEQEQQQKPLVLPHQSLPDQEAHDIFGSERFEIDRSSDMEKLSTQLSLDEDFSDLWTPVDQ